MADGFDGPERPTMPALGPAPQSEIMEAVEAVAEKTAARFLDRIQGFIDEDRRAIVEQFNSHLTIRDDALLDRFVRQQEIAYSGLKMMIRNLREEITREKLARELAQEPNGKPENVRVVLVDDERPTLLAITRVLESRSITVFAVDNTDAAIDVLDQEPIDVVCTDLWMPVNGHRLHDHVRANHPGCETIVMTGDDGEELSRALDAGVFGCLLKPFSIAQAISLIVRAAEHGRLKRHGSSR